MAEAELVAVRAVLAALAQRLLLSEQHSVRVAGELDALRAETDSALKSANQKIDAAGQGGGRGGGYYEDRMDLVDVKTMQPQVFSGHQSESYKQ